MVLEFSRCESQMHFETALDKREPEPATFASVSRLGIACTFCAIAVLWEHQTHVGCFEVCSGGKSAVAGLFATQEFGKIDESAESRC